RRGARSRRPWPSLFQQLQQALVDLPRADGDAQVTREADGGAVPNEDAAGEQTLARVPGVGDAHEQEVRLRRREGDTTVLEARREIRALLQDELARAGRVVRILQRRQRGHLAEPV